jgi:hypothetical protein
MEEHPAPPEPAMIEDLDPEPPARRTQRNEILLGLALVTSVVGLALWQWGSAEKQTQEARVQAAATLATARTDALSGTVALRTQAHPAGLYTYGAAGWQLFPGSDVLSQAEGRCPDGQVLYDGPDPANNAATPSPTRDPDRPLAGQMAGRRLLLAAPGSTAAAVVALTPTSYDWYTCVDDGVWGQRPTGSAEPGTDKDRSVGYAPFAGEPVTIPARPGPGWTTLGVTPRGGRILWARTIHGDSEPEQTALCLAAAAGAPCQELGTFPGTAMLTNFGPDAHMLVLVLQEAPPPPDQITVTVLSLDTDHPTTAHILVKQAINSGDSSYVGADILRYSPRRGQVLVDWAGAAGHLLQLVDRAGLARTLNVGGNTDYLGLINADTGSGGLVLGWQKTIADDTGEATLLYLDGMDYAQVSHVPLPAGWELQNAWIQGDHVVYAIANRLSREIALQVSSRPLAGFGDPTIQATAVLSTTIPAAGRWGVATWRAGPLMLAYRTLDGELRARQYDGSGDMSLQTDAAAFFDPYTQP